MKYHVPGHGPQPSDTVIEEERQCKATDPRGLHCQRVSDHEKADVEAGVIIIHARKPLPDDDIYSGWVWWRE